MKMEAYFVTKCRIVGTYIRVVLAIIAILPVVVIAENHPACQELCGKYVGIKSSVLSVRQEQLQMYGKQSRLLAYDQPCWLDSREVTDSFPGEPLHHSPEGNETLFLIRFGHKDLGKCFLPAKKVAGIGYSNDKLYGHLKIMYSPPGSVDWVETDQDTIKMHGPPANAIVADKFRVNGMMGPRVPRFICHPILPPYMNKTDVDIGIADAINGICSARVDIRQKFKKVVPFREFMILVNPLEAGMPGEMHKLQSCYKLLDQPRRNRQGQIMLTGNTPGFNYTAYMSQYGEWIKKFYAQEVPAALPQQ